MTVATNLAKAAIFWNDADRAWRTAGSPEAGRTDAQSVAIQARATARDQLLKAASAFADDKIERAIARASGRPILDTTGFTVVLAGGGYRHVNHDLGLATTGWGTAEAAHKNADIYAADPANMAAMAHRYITLFPTAA